MALIYKIVDEQAWIEAERAGVFHGAPIDHADGFIHFSAANQLRETAMKHFFGRDNLILVAVEAEALGEALKWEISRGGAPFPHLYGPLLLSKIAFAAPLPLDSTGVHRFPETIPC